MEFTRSFMGAQKNSNVEPFKVIRIKQTADEGYKH
jgi:hypothetical protein